MRARFLVALFVGDSDAVRGRHRPIPRRSPLGAAGRRRGYVAGALVLLAGTVGCGLAPDMASLVAACTVQGFAAGLVIGGTMSLVSALFEPGLRTRVLARPAARPGAIGTRWAP